MSRRWILVACLLVARCAAATTAQAQVDGSDTWATTFLTSSDPFAREDARCVLLGRGPASLPTFAAAMASRDAELRVIAAQSIGVFAAAAGGDAAAMSAARDLALASIDDPEPAVCAAALKSLADCDAVPFDARIVAAVASPHWFVRRAAALALAAVDDARVPSELMKLARDDDAHVHEAAFAALCASPAAGIEGSLVETLRETDDVVETERLLERLRAMNGAEAIEPLSRVVRERRSMRATALACEGLSRRGSLPTAPAPTPLATAAESVTQGDFEARVAAIRVLYRAPRSAATAAVIDALRNAREPNAELLADLVIDLAGPDAFDPLRALALGADAAVTPAGRAASIYALRRFGDKAPLAEFVSSFDPTLPRAVREDLVDAFEERAGTAAGRAGLLAALDDPDGSLRLRAFRVLCETGPLDRVDVAMLQSRVERETSNVTRRRMGPLLAARARGIAAQDFALFLVDRMRRGGAVGLEAFDALESIGDPFVVDSVTRAIVEWSPPPYELDSQRSFLLRLFTKLKSREGDLIVASHLRAAVAAEDVAEATSILTLLCEGGGDHVVPAIRDIAASADEILAAEALGTLLQRGDAEAPALFARVWPSCDARQREELISLVRAPTGAADSRSAQYAAWTETFAALLATDDDPALRVLLVAKIGELRLPLAAALVPFLDASGDVKLRTTAADAIAAIGGDAASAALPAFFTGIDSARTMGASDDDDLLWISAARAVAHIGWIDAAPKLVAELFTRKSKRATSLDAQAGGFAHDEAVLRALLELGRASKQPAACATAFEAELARRRADGSVHLLPKLLLFRLATLLDDTDPAYEATRAALLELVERLPPPHSRRDIQCAIDLGEIAMTHEQWASAAAWYARAARLVDLFDPDAISVVEDEVGAAVPAVGFDPRQWLRAQAKFAQARAAAVAGDSRASADAYEAALRTAPDDVWLTLRVIDDLIPVDPARARAILGELPVWDVHDVDWLDDVAALARALGEDVRAKSVQSVRERLAASGLPPLR